MNINVSIGEFVDKLTILQIKLDKIKDFKKIKNIQKDYLILYSSFNNSWLSEYQDLVKINYEIWELKEYQNFLIIENDLSKMFIQTSKKIVELNKKRFEIKKRINEKFLSEIIDESTL